MRSFIWSLAILLGLVQLGIGQVPFQVVIEPVQFPDLGGVQSFAYGQWQGKWLIIGGRVDGLHRRQPWASFDEGNRNKQLIVIDPVSKQKWVASLASLPVNVQEQFSSTNMQFHQDGDQLIITGGYGYSPSQNDHTTYPFISIVKVPDMVQAIMNGTPMQSYVKQYQDNQFAVAGGYLRKLQNVYYLVGGHRFEGRYNPMNGPSFVQTYTDQVRRFQLDLASNPIQVTHLAPFTSEALMHRRDFNVINQIKPDGTEGITAFAGVFQVAADVPYLTSVHIDSTGMVAQPGFAQYYNHYHCATLPIYDSAKKEMHTLFFGGIAQYYEENGQLVQDNNVPFVSTVARVTRSADGSMAEFKLPVSMPGLLGAGAEFIFAEGVQKIGEEILDMQLLGTDTLMVGYIYGGIKSSAPNIFWTNEGDQSEASARIYQVKLVKGGSVSTDELNPQSTNRLQLHVYPNPAANAISVAYALPQEKEVTMELYHIKYGLVWKSATERQSSGSHLKEIKIGELIEVGTYVLKMKAGDQVVTQKVIINE